MDIDMQKPPSRFSSAYLFSQPPPTYLASPPPPTYLASPPPPAYLASPPPPAYLISPPPSAYLVASSSVHGVSPTQPPTYLGEHPVALSMYPATDRVLLEHARLKLSHSHETERRAAEYTAQLERRVGELDIDLGRARDEASQLREELRRAKAAASEEVRCSAAATRSVKDMQAEVETLRRRCDQYQAKLVDVESDRDQAVATVQALRSAALWTPSGLQSGATVALLTGQLLSARQQQEEHKARALSADRRAMSEQKRANALASKVASLDGKVTSLERERAQSPEWASPPPLSQPLSASPSDIRVATESDPFASPQPPERAPAPSSSSGAAGVGASFARASASSSRFGAALSPALGGTRSTLPPSRMDAVASASGGGARTTTPQR
jgi:hypothetical protein